MKALFLLFVACVLARTCVANESRSLFSPNDTLYMERTVLPSPTSLPVLHFAFFTLHTSEFQASAALAVEMHNRGHMVSLGVPDGREIPAGILHLPLGNLTFWLDTIKKATFDVLSMSPDDKRDFASLVMSTSKEAEARVSEKVGQHMTAMAKRGDLPDVCVFTWLLNAVWRHCSSRNIPVVLQVPSVLTSPLLLHQANRPVEDVFKLDHPSRLPAVIRGRGVLDRLQGILVWTFVKGVVPHLTIPKFNILKDRQPTLQLIHSAAGFDYPADLSHLTRYTGPLYPEGTFDPRHISDEVMMFLSESEALGLPVVYVSLGTLVRLPEKWVHRLYDALVSQAGKRWRALWAYRFPDEKTKFVEDTEHFKIVKWVAGPPVVAHAAVKVVVCHCGFNGLHEALWQRKPVLGIPIIADELPLCDRLVASGCGRSLCHFEATPSAIRDNILNILDNYPIYAAAVFRVSLLLRSSGGLQKAGDLLEITGSLGHERMLQMLQSPSEHDGVFKSYFLDFASLLVLLMFAAGFLAAHIIRRDKSCHFTSQVGIALPRRADYKKE